MDYKKLLGPYKDLPKGIYIIFIARVVNSIGNFIMPFLSIFLTDNLGMTKAQAGSFVMVSGFAFVPGAIIGGKLCDILGRKKVLIISQGLAALCYVPCALPGLLRWIPYFLIVSGFFSGAAGPSHMAMVSDLTKDESRKSAFSFLYLGNNIGFALGPMLAGLLYRTHLPWIFIGDALTTIISLALVVIYVKETMPENEKMWHNEEIADSEKAEEGGMVSALLKRPLLLIFAIIMIAFSFVYAQYTFSLPIQVNDLFKFEGPRYYGVLMSINALTVVLLTPYLTSVTMKLRPTIGIIFGGIQYAIGYGMVYFIHTIPLFIISTIIWTIGEVLVTTNSNVYIANNTPISHRGRFNAVIPIIMGAGFAVGPYLTGMFIDVRGIRPLWLMIFVVSVTASFLMLGLEIFSRYYNRHKRYI